MSSSVPSEAQPPGEWAAEAACVGVAGFDYIPGTFKPFPVRQQKKLVEAYCWPCPVLQQCREWTLTLEDPALPSGGMTTTEIRKAQKALAKAREPAT